MIKEIRNNNIDEVLKSEFAILDFSAEWCGPCRMLAPILEEISDEFDGIVDVFGADTDMNQELAAEFGIQSIPSLLFFKNGEKIDQSVGFIPKEQLIKVIEEHK